MRRINLTSGDTGHDQPIPVFLPVVQNVNVEVAVEETKASIPDTTPGHLQARLQDAENFNFGNEHTSTSTDGNNRDYEIDWIFVEDVNSHDVSVWGLVGLWTGTRFLRKGSVWHQQRR